MTSVPHPARRPLWRRSTWTALTLGALAPAVTLAITFAPASAADAPSGNSGNTGTGNGSSAAVVTPLLEMFNFGDTIGLPLACADSGSVVSIIGTQFKADAATSPLVTQLDVECSQLASQGSQFLQEAIVRSQSLALINPVVDPVIADLSTGLSTVGTQYGPSLAPFGPTVAGLGGTVAFFEGT